MTDNTDKNVKNVDKDKNDNKSDVKQDIILSYNDIDYHEILNQRDEELLQLEHKVEQLCDLLQKQSDKLEDYIKQIDVIKHEMDKIYHS